MTMTRRAMLAVSAVAAGGALAGCSRAVRGRPGPTPATAGHSTATATATATATVPGTGGPRTGSAAPTGGGSATRRAGGGAAVEYTHGPRTRAEVALTFHGAGDPGIARELLAIAAGRRAPITVLAVGAWLAAYPQFAHDIVAGGNELGNHTYNHLDIDALDEPTARTEIVRCRDLLHSLTGSGGAQFRPSQTQHASAAVLRLAGAAGYPTCLSYDVDSLDWTDPGPAAVRRNVAGAAAGSIVSMHFGHRDTVSALPGILADLAARELAPVTATRLLRP